MKVFFDNIMQTKIWMWIIVIAIILITKFVVKLKYISVMEIIKNHLECFRNSKNKLMPMPIIVYVLLPFIMGIATGLTERITDSTINIVTIIVSILTAMLFTMLTMVIDMNAKVKQNKNYYSKEANVSKKALLETYYTIMFEILVSVGLLIACFANCFLKKYGLISSVIIYSLTYMLIINLLMVIKRIFRVIDVDMKKKDE